MVLLVLQFKAQYREMINKNAFWVWGVISILFLKLLLLFSDCKVRLLRCFVRFYLLVMDLSNCPCSHASVNGSHEWPFWKPFYWNCTNWLYINSELLCELDKTDEIWLYGCNFDYKGDILKVFGAAHVIYTLTFCWWNWFDKSSHPYIWCDV